MLQRRFRYDICCKIWQISPEPESPEVILTRVLRSQWEDWHPCPPCSNLLNWQQVRSVSIPVTIIITWCVSVPGMQHLIHAQLIQSPMSDTAWHREECPSVHVHVPPDGGVAGSWFFLFSICQVFACSTVLIPSLGQTQFIVNIWSPCTKIPRKLTSLSPISNWILPYLKSQHFNFRDYLASKHYAWISDACLYSMKA